MKGMCVLSSGFSKSSHELSLDLVHQGPILCIWVILKYMGLIRLTIGLEPLALLPKYEPRSNLRSERRYLKGICSFLLLLEVPN